MDRKTKSYIGMSTCWIAAVAGVWLMVSSWILGYGEPASNGDHTVGPLIASFATVSAWEVLRNVRRINILSGLVLLVLPWILDYPTTATVNSIIVGVMVIALSCVPYPTMENYGGGWMTLLPGRRA